MAALVAPAVSALNGGLKSLAIAPLPLGGQIRKEPKKLQLNEEDKRRRIYETSYEPSLQWWTQNQAEYTKPADDPLPAGFPEQAVTSSLWDGKDLINQPEKWVYHFTAEDIGVIEGAYRHFESLALSNNEISRETFPIPPDSALFKALAATRDQINNGIGLRVLRGLPVDEWERAKQLVIFAGISAYVGTARIKQGTQNVVHLRDITNLEIDKRPAITVKGQTAGNQVFHNDGPVGIVGLITLGVPESGGLSQLSSVAKTYNELASTRRDIVRELAKKDWVNKIYPDGQPLIFAVRDNVISSYSRRPYFGFYEADPDVPPLPTEKHLALDAVHFTAEKYSLDLSLEKGDLEYFNNLTVFHGRTSSVDSEKNARHLVRVHLANPDQPLPQHLRETYERLNSGEATEWPLEAWESVDKGYDRSGEEKKT